MSNPKGVAPSVVLCNPKLPHNVGGVLRACSCFGIEQLWWTGERVTFEHSKGKRLPREERMKGFADVDVFPNFPKPFECFDRDVVPVGVELVQGAQLLPHFKHPAKTVYVFGPEDGSIPTSIRHLCHTFVAIPTAHCLNLSNAVNLVLYDRLVKRMAAGEIQGWSLADFLKEQRGWYDGVDPLFGIEER